jgi:hypothetical protein
MGNIKILDGAGVDPDLLVYTRNKEFQTVLVVINFSDRSISFKNSTGCHQVLLAVSMDQPQDLNTFWMPPFSAVLLAG